MSKNTVGKFIRGKCQLLNPSKAKDLFFTYDECRKTCATGMSFNSYRKRCAEIFSGYVRANMVKEPKFVADETTDHDIVGVIGDIHAPFDHPNYADFCYDTFVKHGVTRVVAIGDIADNHAISRHQTETCAMSSHEEYAKTLEHIKKYTEAFPVVDVCIGNHDNVPTRQVATLGIPDVFLKSFSALWELPETWNIVEDIIINGVYFFHGTGSAGKMPAFNRALSNRMSTVQGHAHSAFGVMYHANPMNIVFGCDTGCGILNDAYAFEYGKPFPKKPVLGCSVIYSSTEAYAVPMSEKYFRS